MYYSGHHSAIEEGVATEQLEERARKRNMDYVNMKYGFDYSWRKMFYWVTWQKSSQEINQYKSNATDWPAIPQ